ncbi:MAG: copper resistance protein B [Shewanella psychromarinicola]|jgi:copper resistance protein B|uniref:copper resistance protein B n=1 Tax=Shewanella TaxID=22 RepID=UPI000C33FCBF|nr:copper resistance protein B [Shewanella sp. Actino-trap-3]PKG77579.1 copper resistance protein CopB [Shewanella sp. Actino-trap-3]|tara:strand:+ start:45107 stop:45820 length:714 start_codon:yes stop_codon:yes gene_type:complete
MNKVNLIVFGLLSLSSTFASSFVYAGGNDDPLLAKVMLDQLERGVDPQEATQFSAQAWLGYDLNKLWLKTEGEYLNSDEQDLEIQALYSRPIAPYWDIQLGVKTDIKPSPTRNWAVIGVQGLAPYFFDIDAALFVSEEGRTAMRLSAEYELLITQQLILSPEIEVNLFAKNDAELGIGSGVSDVSAGLRLRYEIIREFAPYIGVDWRKKFGNTADYARNEGEDTQETQLVIGFKAWF